MIVLIYLLFLFSIAARFLWGVPIVVSGSGIWTSDILAVVIIILIPFIKDRDTDYIELFFGTKLRIAATSIILIFIAPLINGITYSYSIITIFRDARLIPVYASAFIFLIVVYEKEQLEKYIKFILVTAAIMLFVFFIMFFFNLKFPVYFGLDVDYQTSAGIIPRYGVSTATFYYPLAFFIILNLFMYDYFAENNTWIIILLFLFLFAIFFYSMRTFSIGVAIAFIINLLISEERFSAMKFVLPIIIVMLAAIFIVPRTKLIHIPQIERHLSIIDPSYSTRGVENTKQIRFQAIEYAFRLTENPIIGSGLGDKQTYSKELRVNYARWWNHSSIGWAFYKLGLILTAIFIAIFTWFLYLTFKLYKELESVFYKNVVLGIFIFLLSTFGLAAGTNIFFRGDFLTMEVSICIGIILAIENLHLNEEILS